MGFSVANRVHVLSINRPPAYRPTEYKGDVFLWLQCNIQVQTSTYNYYLEKKSIHTLYFDQIAISFAPVTFTFEQLMTIKLCALKVVRYFYTPERFLLCNLTILWNSRNTKS